MPTLSDGEIGDALAGIPPGAPAPAFRREPVQVLYGGAHLFKKDAPEKMGRAALAALEQYAPAAAFSKIFDLPTNHARVLRERIAAKLEKEPVEDLRVDFEDGFGPRSDAEEDAEAARAGAEAGAGAKSLPPFFGLRVKSFSSAGKRAARTLDLFLSAFFSGGGRDYSGEFLVTLPKIERPEEAAALARLLASFEKKAELPLGKLKVEIMVETPRSIQGSDGRAALSDIARALGTRLAAAHFGTYDFTAAMGVAAAHQRPDHPLCDMARAAMQTAFAGTGVRLSDGAVTTLPVALHRTKGAKPTQSQILANAQVVRAAWRLHYDAVRRSMSMGLYQGWDLHPAQLVSRYCAVYAFYLDGLDEAAARMKNFLASAARATRVGASFDDAASALGLLNHFRRGRFCGALGEEDLAGAGLNDSALSRADFLEYRR